MKYDLKTLPDDIGLLKEIILSQVTTIDTIQNKYDNLLEQIRLEKMRRFAPKTESDLTQLSLFDECGLPNKQNDAKEETVTISEHTRSKNPKRQALPDDLPRQVVMHDIPESEKQCACGCQKERFSEEVTEQLEIVPAKLTVTQHVRPKYRCPSCQTGVAIAKMPTLLLPKTMAAPSLVAHIIVSKYVDHLPLYRQEQIFKRLDIDLARNTTCDWVLKTAELCEPLWWVMKKQLVAQDYIQADETTMQVLKEPNRKNNCKSYIWVYRGGPPDKKVVIYDYQQTRQGKHAREFLADFKGYLQTDGYQGYDWFNQAKHITHLACFAHARRPFAELVKLAKKKKGMAHQAIEIITKLYEVEKIARENHYSAERRHQLRLEKSKAILSELRQWLVDNIPHAPKQSKLGKAIRYSLDRWQELNHYLKDGRLEIDNNLVENAIRPFTLGRGNWLFAGSPRGAEASATLYSLAMTCKANDINPFDYFNRMLPELRLCETEEDFEKLLPFNIFTE